jgi:trans-2,3-dihydro-3-hydroxyanthranilate isomerase
MTPLRYLHLDVFADGPSGGHPLIVCLGPCRESAMPALSHEFGLVVAFPVVTSPRRYHVRIFEHGHELPFGGQPTLGAAWSLGPGRWRQDSRGASVEVEAMADGARMSTPDPVLDPIDDDSLLAAISGVLGMDIDCAYRTSCAGNTHLIVPVRADIADLTVDYGEVARICEAAGMNTLSPFRWHAGEIIQRVFAPTMGIPESPAAGTAAVPAAAYARQAWGAGLNIRVHQGHGTGRASLIKVHAERGVMTLAGVVRKFAEGTCEVG